MTMLDGDNAYLLLGTQRSGPYPRDLCDAMLANAKQQPWFAAGEVVVALSEARSDDDHFYGAWRGARGLHALHGLPSARRTDPALAQNYPNAITKEASDAIRAYCDLNYIPINEMLRNGTVPGYTDPAVVKQQIADMLTAVQPLPTATALYRGTSAHAFGLNRSDVSGGMTIQALREQLVGKTFTDKGFISTSSTTNLLEYLGGMMRMNITAPAGTMAIDTRDRTQSRFPGEKEVILAPGTQFHVDSIDKIFANGHDTIVMNVTVQP